MPSDMRVWNTMGKEERQMNREERRRYDKEMRHDPMASRCPGCGKKSRKIALPVPKKRYLCDIVCERCGYVVAKDSNTAIPMTYV